MGLKNKTFERDEWVDVPTDELTDGWMDLNLSKNLCNFIIGSIHRVLQFSNSESVTKI